METANRRERLDPIFSTRRRRHAWNLDAGLRQSDLQPERAIVPSRRRRPRQVGSAHRRGQIEITDGPFAGHFTTSNAAGEFQFSDPSSVSELVTLRIFKPGYRSAYARPDRFRIVVTLLSMDDQHTITFTAAETCSALPSSVRSRSLTTTLWDFTPGSLDLPLTGADFFPGLEYHGGPDSRFPRTIFCVERRGVPAMGR